MAFGVKIKNIKTKKGYTLEEFLEVMKTVQYDAGEPSIVKHGFNQVICFPPIDRQNQVWVMGASFKQPFTKFSIQLSHDIAGDFGNMAKNAILDKITDGWAGMGTAFGKNRKDGENFVVDVYNKLSAMDL